MPTVGMFTLVVPGEPRGMARAMSRGHHRYKSAEQKAYDELMVVTWRASGSPRLPEGPWAMGMVAYFKRPQDHWRADGTLSAKGVANPYPQRTPDLDNVMKQIDAMVAARAVPDDARLVKAELSKVWAPRGRQRLVFVFRSLVQEEA